MQPIRKAVDEWRKEKYKGATATTKTLLNYWFATDHRLTDGRPFQYYPAQREAVETLVWLYEVQGIRRHRDLIERFAKVPGIHVLQYDDYARYAIKMATGSGKTKVMALAVAWQYFNAVAEGRDDYAATFLIVAPNVIVFERLRFDFGGGRIFRTDPIIPRELSIFWDMDFYMRSDPERGGSQGALYLTNIQQFYERTSVTDSNEPGVMTDVLGPIPSSATSAIEDFDSRIAARNVSALVINDEGHHVHDEDSEWSKVIRRLHERIPTGACRATRLFRYAPLPERRPFHLDNLRLSTKAGDHRGSTTVASKGCPSRVTTGRSVDQLPSQSIPAMLSHAQPLKASGTPPTIVLRVSKFIGNVSRCSPAPRINALG